MKYLHRLAPFLCVSLLCAFVACAAERAQAPLPMRDIVLQSGAQQVSFKVELATTDEQRAKGLMFRRALPENQGMLFVWPVSTMRSMWMKNTFIPLDILFIHQGEVVGIVERTTPRSLTQIKVDNPADMVLELPAGAVRTHGIAVGWRLAGITAPELFPE
jgi:uncharacterized membrane protein (UPF0127 family)